ncbi:MAG: amidase family protein [Candidatus Diapherotrites archaeon]
MISVVDYVRGVSEGKISILDYVSKVCDEIEEKNSVYSHFNFFDRAFVVSQAEALERDIKKGRKGKLLGVPVSVKDCLCVKGIESKAGSKILSGYKPFFDATAVAKVRSEGAIILGKTSQDEFGFGSFSVNSDKVPLNPFDLERSCGGSSGGAAGFAALTKHTHVAIAESTGGSIACPASFCGVSSLTPTYGVVSRYGLIDYANSLDKIGVIGKSMVDVEALFSVLVGRDEKDSTSVDFSYSVSEVGKVVLGVPSDLLDLIEDEKIKSVFYKKLDFVESLGHKVVDVSFPLNSKFGVAVYYLIAMAEASTNLAKYCGMRYGAEESVVNFSGNFNDYFSFVRSKYFGTEAKRRIMVGTFVRMSGFRDAYYLRAMKARTLLIEEFKKAFSKVDFLAWPAMPMVAPKFSEIAKLSPVQNYAADLCTVPPNLAGLPHATINAGFVNSLPLGFMVVGDHFVDSKLVSFMKSIETNGDSL